MFSFTGSIHIIYLDVMLLQRPKQDLNPRDVKTTDLLSLQYGYNHEVTAGCLHFQQNFPKLRYVWTQIDMT